MITSFLTSKFEYSTVKEKVWMTNKRRTVLQRKIKRLTGVSGGEDGLVGDWLTAVGRHDNRRLG